MRKENDAENLAPGSGTGEDKPEPKSYYYDDATGYEVYEPERTSDEEESEDE